MKPIQPAILIACALGWAAPASAQFAKPEDAIKYRQNALFVMQQHFSRVAGMATGKVPFDAQAAADNASVAEAMSKLPWAAFVPGSDKGKTEARAEIWKEPAKFKEAAEKTQVEMTKLAAVAKTGNLDNLKTAVRAVGSTCKSCHDSFRQD